MICWRQVPTTWNSYSCYRMKLLSISVSGFIQKVSITHPEIILEVIYRCESCFLHLRATLEGICVLEATKVNERIGFCLFSDDEFVMSNRLRLTFGSSVTNYQTHSFDCN